MKYITPQDYETAAKNGINKDTVRMRVTRNNWSVEDAITTPSERYDIPKNLLEEAISLGLNRQLVINRIKVGWSVEDACRTLKRGKMGRPRKDR